MATLAELFAGPWGPVLIFACRLVDVTMGTVRILLIVQGRRSSSSFLGMIEVTIWVLAAGTAIQNLSSPLHLAGYAMGFGAGSALGSWVEERLAIGWVSLRIISPHYGVEIAEALREAGFGVTEFQGLGASGRVEIAISVIRRRRMREALGIIEQWGPDAFVTMESPRTIQRGYTPRV